MTANRVNRRTFLKLSGGAAAGAAAFYAEAKLAFLQPGPGISNPLEQYPNRGWEEVYRDQYRYDRSFTFVCAPNDTHNCRLRGFVRNGILTRIEQNYDSGRIGDLDGNTSTVQWNPRGCVKGLTFQRRVHGPSPGTDCPSAIQRTRYISRATSERPSKCP